ncbi:MAG: PIN domain-containing protein [Deltaproteobacteria bacterium]|nr:PIN domain-containing protein [Deltaproteobacteria bacterium]
MRTLVDTNVWVYAYDKSDPDKHVRAVRVIEQLSYASDLVVSAQVLNELARVLLERRQREVDLVSTIIDEVTAAATCLPLTAETTRLALSAGLAAGLSFWDALIWAAASQNDIAVVLSEDFQHGRELEGVRFTNPFLGG